MKVLAKNEIIICFFIILFSFQKLLEKFFSPFSFIDESVALITFSYYTFQVFKKGKVAGLRDYKYIIVFFLLYLFICMLGNILFRYQVISSVVIDFITNMKFYLSLGFVGIFDVEDPQQLKKIPKLGRGITVFLFGLFIFDYILKLFPSGVRYGIRWTGLYFGHPTYCAGFCAFLVALLSYYGAKKNIIYIYFNLFMMVMTLRGKAIAGALCFLLLYYIVFIMHTKLQTWQIVLLAFASLTVAWQQIHYYFIELAGKSARSVMLLTSFKIMRDYFPIGTGFGTYGSHEAAANYSPVYVKYGFRDVLELSGTGPTFFADDHFWPIIFGQSGVLGTICYLAVLGLLFFQIQKMRKINKNAYISSMFSFLYLLISSTSEPAFNNLIAIPIGVVMGMTMLTMRNAISRDKTLRD